MSWTRILPPLLMGLNKLLWVNDALRVGATATWYYLTRRKRAGRSVAMMPHELDPNQRSAIGVVVDICSDIREIYSCLILRSQKKKLSEIEELAQEEDSKAMVSLENDLDCYYDTCLALDLPEELIEQAIKEVLPADRFDQLCRRRSATTV